MDSDTRRDWTFPAPHFYNVPGWYHAVFLISASGFFGWALALVLAQMREEAPVLALGRIRSIGAVGVLVPGLAFLGLLEEDELAGNPAIGLILSATMTAFGAVLCVALAWACGRHAIRWCALAVLGSLLPAIALCDLFLPRHEVGSSSALLAGAAGLAAVFLSAGIMSCTIPRVPAARVLGSRVPGSRGAALCVTACQAMCAVSPVYVMASAESVTVFGLATGIVGSLLLAACEFFILQALLCSQPRRA
ncbi:MAG: hypothetical protein J2P25_22435 [Nocardiopsaceae bacterium]|nr:hypothetical protein [Nocardiopsaceae bacterium]